MAHKQAKLTAVGWESDLEIVDFEPPEPRGVQVRIAVEACGVCYRDTIDRDGRWPFMQLPVAPGHEVVGRVEAVGPRVSDWKIGDRVATLHRDGDGFHVLGIIADGGYATAMVAPQACFYAAPEDATAAEAAVLHCTFGTAFQGLSRAGAVEGQRVVVTGANGGVGVAAVQVAKRLGLESIAVVRSDGHSAALKALGADHVVVSPGGRFHKQLPGGKVDVVLDCVGPPTFNSSLRSLKMDGKLVVIGNVSSDRAELNLGYVILNSLTIIGSRSASREEMAALVALRGGRAFVVDATELGLSDADRAQRAVRAGGLLGRFVLRP